MGDVREQRRVKYSPQSQPQRTFKSWGAHWMNGQYSSYYGPEEARRGPSVNEEHFYIHIVFLTNHKHIILEF